MTRREAVVRFDIHRRYHAEHQSIRYMLECLRDLHQVETNLLQDGKSTTVIRSHELPELERLLTMLEQREFELRLEKISKKWVPSSKRFDIANSKKLETTVLDGYCR